MCDSDLKLCLNIIIIECSSFADVLTLAQCHSDAVDTTPAVPFLLGPGCLGTGFPELIMLNYSLRESDRAGGKLVGGGIDSIIRS